ncbi:uncharacterized protein LOC100247168 [Vitis vinifera]|uniref:uncharacterized protein LOC100247168 n=1 Tax=Vitis vinifera TaxID=29760 RepID=UPI002882EB4F|nr:uncharacterized protein LOC100247168 [Vitis vinifera]
MDLPLHGFNFSVFLSSFCDLRLLLVANPTSDQVFEFEGKEKQMELKAELGPAKMKQVSPPPPPLPPPLPRFWVATKPMITESVTNQEIAKFWRQKRMEEEDHLLAALKAAARIRAQKLTEDEYQQYEESLEDADNEDNSKQAENDKALRVGIKDWWTKSKYAYLNQPAIGSMDTPKRRRSSYIPNVCSYKLTPPQPTYLGVF